MTKKQLIKLTRSLSNQQTRVFNTTKATDIGPSSSNSYNPVFFLAPYVISFLGFVTKILRVPPVSPTQAKRPTHPHHVMLSQLHY